MIDPELKNHLETVEKRLESMDKATSGWWRIFRNGLVYGAGYVIGGLLILVIVGWILNAVGVIPAFTNQVTQFRSALENAKQAGK